MTTQPDSSTLRHADQAPHRPSVTAARGPAVLAGQALAGVVGLGCAALAGWLALHHPLSPALAMAGVVLLAAAQATWPPLWLVALPALLPWLGLGAWTGWLVAEESDMAILAIAAGSYLRWLLRPGPRQSAGRASRAARHWGQLLLLAWLASVLLALQLGVQNTGGWASAWELGWWQGLREPLNALRVAKPTIAVLLLLPLWWRLQQQPGQRCADWLSLGLALCLAGVTAWCVYERMAFPGLLNMSEDYRTTGPFWETQVGGAALDACLALTLPFALRLAWRARHPLAVAASTLVVLAGVYAGLTTFSRIVYLALPAGALLYLWLQHRQDGAAAPRTAPSGGAAAIGLLVLALATTALWLFPVAGYRGLLALLGSAALLLLLAPHSTGRRPMAWAGAWLGGLLLGAPLWLLMPLLPKGAYIVYAAVTLLTGALLLRGTSARRWPLTGALFVAQLGCGLGVALTWGGNTALPAAATTTLVLGAAWVLLGLLRQPAWPAGLAWPARGLVALVVALAGVAVFGGGQYMSTRLSQTESDRAGRWQHWRDGLALSGTGASFWLGQGLGRYADLYALHHDPKVRPGDLRLVQGEQGPMVRTVAGNHMLGRGELLRLSQRLADVPATGLRLVLTLRTPAPVKLRIELCAKHLIYDDACRMLEAYSKAGLADWQTLNLALPDAAPGADAGLPRWAVLSVASETSMHPIDIRQVQLLDGTGHDWLHNGDFRAGGARWFITSDRNHLPWHAKNMGVHLVVEQGVLGLLAMLALGVGALAATLGPLRRHPLAPPLAAAIVGVWVVGSVDSVLDIPRTATWVLLLHAMGLQLFLPSRARHRGTQHGTDRAAPGR